MSLINRMLQDLESRHAAATELGAVSGDVRALPQRPAAALSWARIGTAVCLAVLLVWGALYWLEERQGIPRPIEQGPVAAAKPASPPEPVVAVPPSAASSPAAAVAPPVATAAPPPEIPAAKPAPDATAAAARKSVPAARRGEAGLKVSTTLTVPREYLERAAGPVAMAAVPSASSAQRRKGEEPPSIEKQMRSVSPGERAESEYRKAAAHYNQGRLSEAIEALRGALQADPQHDAARMLLSGLLLEQQRLDEAQALLKEGLALNPAQPQLAMRLARLQVERGDSPAAADTLRKAAAGAADSAEFRGFYAAVLQRLGRHAEAAREFQAALRLAPQAGLWWMGLGISLEEENRAAEAREAYQKARASGVLSPDLEQFVARKLKQLQ
jgi:MSHA biogenesis protein MshN